MKKTTILTLIASSVLASSVITNNFSTNALAAKTEKTNPQKSIQAEKAKKKAIAKQKKINKGWKKANAEAYKRAFGKSHKTHKKADKVVDGFDTVTNQVVDQNAYVTAIQTKLLAAINNLRAQQGSNPVSTGNLQNVANIRAQQVSNNMTHYDQNGQTIVDELATQQGIYQSYDIAKQNISENASLEDFDIPDVIVHNTMLQFENEAPYGGHYLNTVNPNNKTINIGVYVDNQNQTIYLAENYTS